MPLSVGDFREIAYVSYGRKCNYIHVCAAKPYDILKAKKAKVVCPE